MKITLTKNMFINHFQQSSRAEQFTYEALEAIYDYYEYDEDIELDIIAICCEWTEYESLEKACDSYCIDLTDFDDNDTWYILEKELDNNVGYLIKLDNDNYLIMD